MAVILEFRASDNAARAAGPEAGAGSSGPAAVIAFPRVSPAGLHDVATAMRGEQEDFDPYRLVFPDL